MAGIAGDLFPKLYLVILVSGKLALRGWFGSCSSLLLCTRIDYPTAVLLPAAEHESYTLLSPGLLQ